MRRLRQVSTFSSHSLHNQNFSKMSNMRLLWLVQADLHAIYVVLCAFIWRNLGFIGLNSQQKKKIVHLYSVQQT